MDAVREQAQTADGHHPPGWYKDPWGGGMRYWNGGDWTEWHTVATRRRRGASDFDVAAVVVALLLPPIGLVLGSVGLARRRMAQGLIVLAVSLAAIPVWWVVAGALAGR